MIGWLLRRWGRPRVDGVTATRLDVCPSHPATSCRGRLRLVR